MPRIFRGKAGGLNRPLTIFLWKYHFLLESANWNWLSHWHSNFFCRGADGSLHSPQMFFHTAKVWKIVHSIIENCMFCSTKKKNYAPQAPRNVSPKKNWMVKESFVFFTWVLFTAYHQYPVKERGNWYLMGGGASWDSCPEVIHIEQILDDYLK